MFKAGCALDFLVCTKSISASQCTSDLHKGHSCAHLCLTLQDQASVARTNVAGQAVCGLPITQYTGILPGLMCLPAHMHTHTSIHTYIDTYRRTDSQADIQADRQTDVHLYLKISRAVDILFIYIYRCTCMFVHVFIKKITTHKRTHANRDVCICAYTHMQTCNCVDVQASGLCLQRSHLWTSWLAPTVSPGVFGVF